jgi:hypothetical protein
MLLVRAMPMQSQQEVQDALQYAIELEHATIPPYLTALYSLQPGKNQAIAALLKGIVFEEMQHMTLAANMLNAIGGQPLVNDPKFIPQYPGGLPFHIGDRHGQQLEVPLKAFSLSVVENVFMRIEEPDDPIVFPAGTPFPRSRRCNFKPSGFLQVGPCVAKGGMVYRRSRTSGEGHRQPGLYAGGCTSLDRPDC